jgi:hypothetical protein
MRIQVQEFGAKHTRPMERETTRQHDAPDSKAFTRPFDKLREDKLAEDKLSKQDTSPLQKDRARKPADISQNFPTAPRDKPSEKPSETPRNKPSNKPSKTQRESARKEHREAAAEPRIQPAPIELSGLRTPPGQGFSVGAEGFGPADRFEDAERAELRARAAGPHSQTQLSREDIQAEFRRFSRPDVPNSPNSPNAPDGAPPNPLHRALFALAALVVVGLLAAIVWALASG